MNSKLPDRPSGPRRNRHGRGRRGPLMPMHLPAYRSRPERFDDAVMASAQRLAQRWPGKIEKIEFLIDPVPSDKLLDQASALGERVPLASSVPAGARRPARIIIYRLPIEQIAENTGELLDLVHQCVVHEVAQLWMKPISEVDPSYFPEDPDF
ncbi:MULTISPECIES: metallopeptidase family protein [Glutamicibacter]|jgi:predicted Zn-dependent protease with MMP-like domain|uniref:Metallopeptidase family protein n=1 Tax=Glutamicibacter arilaitensis TaxID=256701 RepID=A0A4Y8TVR0_9MICC|nr:metallopeptidase family protein [Glutamicibacter arilaitensis]TFH54929.1 metallopeptidase family protein [Glutamicibacter arilaitensis]